ncbi:MAG: serine/threonine-protein kinase [Lysobacteraceae bacterium]
MDSTRWQQVSALLDELFVLDEAQQNLRLSRIEREDAALADELRHILAADAASSILDVNVAHAAPTVMRRLDESGAHTPVAVVETGKRVGHYHLIERIGAGGMGEVWRAERNDDFEQQVAVKLIRPLMDSLSLRERFARERRILARLDHPGIARLLDGGITDDGTPWYSMEFVRGTDIVRHANGNHLDVRARVELLLQVCDAVAHAQAQLVVHRDLKPSNILVDGEGRARVLDFGIARLIDDSAEAQLTGTGVRLFSPAWAAPEQIRGEAVGTAADVFALGAILYELLVGEVPWPRRNAAPETLLAQLQQEAAPKPSQAFRRNGTGTTAVRGISADLDTIVATALQPEPARRYAGAAQLAQDLRRWLDGRPIWAQPDTAAYRMRKFVARHRIAVGSASTVLLALIAGLGFALWQAGIARDHALRAEREAAQARVQAERTLKVKEFLVSVFTAADPMRRSANAPQTVEQAFDAALERARAELSSDPVLQADVLDDFGEIRANQGRFDEARVLFDQALQVAESEYGPDHPAVAESLMNLAAVDFMGGKASEAVQHIGRVVSILEKDDGGNPAALPNALSGQAAILQQIGDVAAMRKASSRAVQLYRERAPDDPSFVVALSNEAAIAVNAGEPVNAHALLSEAIALIERHHGRDSPNLWSSLDSLANLAYVRGDIAEQTALTERALALARASFPGDHPWVANSMAERGLQHARAGRIDEGETMLHDAVAMYARLGSSDELHALRQLAIAQRLNGDDKGAMASLERGLALCRAAGETASQGCIVTRANRALLLARTGHAQQALEEAQAADDALPKDAALYSERSQISEARAAAFATLGQHREALAEQDAAIALLQENLGPGHPETVRVTAARAALER